MNNQSSAKSFIVNSIQNKQTLINAEFISNINTSAQYDRPHFSQPAFSSYKDDSSSFYMALRTQTTIAILDIQNQNIQIKYQLEFADNFIKQNKIVCFEFLKNQTTIGNEKHLLIGFNSGLIILVDYFTTNFINNYNIREDEKNDSQKPIKYNPVTKICIIPHKQQFLALFQDSTMQKFQIETQNQCNDRLFDEIKKLEDISSFEKNISIHTPQRKKKEFYEICSISSIDEFKLLAIFCQDQDKNPVAYFKHKCSSISDIVVLCPENYAYKYVTNEEYEPLVIAFTGFDGYLRIVDIHNLKPIYLFKSNYGGINSVVFKTNVSPILALSCQDDSTIILNLETQVQIRLQSQASFISRVIFQDIDDNLFRVISASYDGTIAIKELQKQSLIEQQQQKDQNQQQQQTDQQEQTTNMNSNIKVEESKIQENNKNKISQKNKQNNLELDPIKSTKQKIPIIQIYDKNVSLELENDQTIVVNREGLGYIDKCGNTIITSSFDGCCSIWNFSDATINPTKNNDKQGNEGSQKQQIQQGQQQPQKQQQQQNQYQQQQQQENRENVQSNNKPQSSVQQAQQSRRI